MDMLDDWLSPLTQTVLKHVSDHGLQRGIKGPKLSLGRKGQVTSYEHDSSNLRVYVDATRNVQIEKWKFDGSSTEAILSDGHTKIRSIFPRQAIKNYQESYGRVVTQGTEGGIVQLSNFEIVVSLVISPQVSLYIKDFKLIEGCEGTALFGRPYDIHTIHRVMELTKGFGPEKKTTKESPEDPSHDSEDSSSSIESQIASQLKSGDAIPGGSAESQERIATQAPPQPLTSPKYFQPRSDKDILQHLNPPRNPPQTTNDHQDIRSAAHTAQHNDQHQPLSRPRTPQSNHDLTRNRSAPLPERQDVSGDAVSLALANGDHTAEAQSLEPRSAPSRKRKSPTGSLNQGNNPPISTTSAVTAKSPFRNNRPAESDNGSRYKRLRMQDVRIAKDQEELIDGDSWIPPPPGYPMPQGRVPAPLLKTWNDYRSRPRKTKQLSCAPVNTNNRSGMDGGKFQSSTKWTWTRRIHFQDARIPKDQQKLIDSPSSWVPPQSGDRMPQGHVPIKYLQEWNENHRSLNEKHPDPSLPADGSLSEISGSQEQQLLEDLQSSPHTSVAWSMSPERGPQRPNMLLPPDSSPEEEDPGSQVNSKSTHGNGISTESPEQILPESGTGEDNAPVGETDTRVYKLERDCEETHMHSSLPFASEPQTQPQGSDEVEEISSSGPVLPISASKGNSFTQVKQSPTVVSLGSRRTGHGSTKDTSSSQKIPSDPRIPATYDSRGINDPQRPANEDQTSSSQDIPLNPGMVEVEVEATLLATYHDGAISRSNNNSHSSQTNPSSAKVLDTPLEHHGNNSKSVAPQNDTRSMLSSEVQFLKRNRGNGESPAQTPSKRHKSLGSLKLDDAPRSSSFGDISDSVVERRQAYMRRAGTPRGTTDIFEKFKQSYPDYEGSEKHFTSMCRKLQALRNQGKMAWSMLWDDFIIQQTTSYRKYVKICADEVEDWVSYEEYFVQHVTKPQFKKRSFTERDLKIVLSECGDPHAPNVSSKSATPVPATCPSRTPFSRAGSGSLVNSPKLSRATSVARDEQLGVSSLEIAETQSQPEPGAGEPGDRSSRNGNNENHDATLMRQDSRSDHEDDGDDGGGGHDDFASQIGQSSGEDEEISHGSDEDEEDNAAPNTPPHTHDSGNYGDDREIPCTPMEDIHETASVELGDDIEDSPSQQAAQRASRGVEETFSDPDFEPDSMETGPETPRAAGIPGETSTLPIELGSSLESKIESKKDTSQENMDLDEILEADDDDEWVDDDGSSHDEDDSEGDTGDDKDSDGDDDENYRDGNDNGGTAKRAGEDVDGGDSEESDEGTDDEIDARTTSHVSRKNGSPSRSASRSSHRTSPMRTRKSSRPEAKKTPSPYLQVLEYSTSSSESDVPPPTSKRSRKSSAQPAQNPPQEQQQRQQRNQQPNWAELPNTAYKWFAQSYATLRSELGEQNPTYWSKLRGSATKDRELIPVDEKGAIRPPLRGRYRHGEEGSDADADADGKEKFLKRGRIGWSF
ncbi:hypothetical protein FQN54_003769 [Arachnomyces sp. PD_36]|nr:hypothetical protein FQN54_003769 [Arachnomyces sp. PD_36]